MNLLFVCTANLCRSPLAEHLFRRRAGERGLTGIGAASAGIRAVDGYPPLDTAVEAARAHGLDLSTHRSRRFVPAMVADGDLVLVMEREHERAVRALTGLGPERVLLLGSLAPGPEEIPDPVGLPLAGYDRCIARLEACIGALLGTLAGAG